MGILFFALATGNTILIMAGLAFLGVTDPFVPTWGVMVRNVYDSGLLAQSYWWAIPPGLMIALTVLSLFMIGRSIETMLDDDENIDTDATNIDMGG